MVAMRYNPVPMLSETRSRGVQWDMLCLPIGCSGFPVQVLFFFLAIGLAVAARCTLHAAHCPLVLLLESDGW